jgi:hypothetical protein
MWVLRTNTTFAAADVALKYKQLWMVESIFRSAKSLLETRLEKQGDKLEWADISTDLRALQEVEVEMLGKKLYLRTDLRGACHTVLQAAGVAPRRRSANDRHGKGGLVVVPTHNRCLLIPYGTNTSFFKL